MNEEKVKHLYSFRLVIEDDDLKGEVSMIDARGCEWVFPVHGLDLQHMCRIGHESVGTYARGEGKSKYCVSKKAILDGAS
jgi:hypothetical protein